MSLKNMPPDFRS